jgi:multiple sugar transport system permease protein
MIRVLPRSTIVGTRATVPVRHRLLRVLLHAMLLIGGLSCLVPFLWLLSTSLKTAPNVISIPPQFIPAPLIWDNYVHVFSVAPMLRYFLNSVGVVAVIVAGQVLSNSLAAYAFARLEFRGRDALFFAYLGTMMVPGQVTLIPSFILMKYLGWIDTYYALTVPFMLGSAFGTFLLRQSFLAIPAELEHAARIDGCGYLRLYARIAMPLSKPALATFGVFSFLYFWNDFLWPLIVTNSNDHKTLQVGLVTIAQSYFGTDWGALTAGTVVSIVPMVLIFLFAQRYFVQGITLTGLKG